MRAAALSRRALLAAGLPALGALVHSGPALAAGFPQQSVRMVVPYAVGIGPDVVARGVAEQLARRWGQPVLVDNKPGASGIVAFGDVRRTPADGHTLYLADTATLVVNPLLHSQLPYDPQTDLLPLSLLFRATFLLWTGGNNPHRTLADLLAHARQAPDAVRYATLGNGHASHVAMETFAQAAGVRMLHVPFKDAGAMLVAVVSGEVDVTPIGMNSVAGLMASGRLRPLAVGARQRLASHPAIPTLAEAGGPPVEMHPWAGLVVRAGTPAAVLAQLQDDLQAALVAPELRSRTEQAGFELTPSSPQALRDRMAADLAIVKPLLDEGRIARL
jgi:tripartite-type tricarboxylate transporter receptor subunit TctC